jgi:hypothetical protein
MLKKISAALLVASMIAAPAMAASSTKNVTAPVAKSVQAKPGAAQRQGEDDTASQALSPSRRSQEDGSVEDASVLEIHDQARRACDQARLRVFHGRGSFPIAPPRRWTLTGLRRRRGPALPR